MATRPILFDADGRVRSAAQIELTQCYPRPGWIEHDPEEIWRSVVSICREAVTAADAPIAAIGIANQRDDRDRSRHRNRRGDTLKIGSGCLTIGFSPPPR